MFRMQLHIACIHVEFSSIINDQIQPPPSVIKNIYSKNLKIAENFLAYFLEIFKRIHCNMVKKKKRWQIFKL